VLLGVLLVLLLPVLLQPAASIPIAAAMATAARQLGAWSRILTHPHLQVVMALNVPLLACGRMPPCRRHRAEATAREPKLCDTVFVGSIEFCLGC
jgi:hypothetical protein